MERLYSIPSWQLAIALFVILLGGMFGGFLLGKNAARRGEQEAGAADSAAASIFAFNGGTVTANGITIGLRNFIRD
jgi:hypothetical protein